MRYVWQIMTTSALQHFKVDNFQQTLAITVCHDTGTTRYKKPKKKKKKFWPVPALNGCGVNFWLHFLCLIYSMHLNASSMVRLNSTGSVYTMCAFTSMLMHVIWSLRMSAASLQNTHNSLLIMLSLFFCLLLYSIHLSSVFLFTIQITKANLLYS